MNELVEALPHLTDEELEQLDIAINVRVHHLRAIIATAQASRIQDDAKKALQINLSLLTAVSETRMSIASRKAFLEEAVAHLTKAEPGEDGLCMTCHKEIKSVPGGNGPVFVHTDTQVVICAGQDI